MPLPSLRALEALRAFVEGGSVSQAAARLGRTQPQVGRLLAGLEAELGFPLFTRQNRRLALTAAAVRFYRHAERVLAGHEELAQLAGEIRLGRRDDHVRLLVAPPVMGALFGDALVAMAREVPTFTVSVDARMRLDIEAWVGQEAFDLGVSVLPLAHPAVTVEEICRTEAVALMHPDHKLARRSVVEMGDLAGQDLILTHPRSLVRQHMERALRAAGQAVDIRFEATHGTTACQLAALGLGVAIVDPFVAMVSAPGLVMRRLRPTTSLPYALMYPASQVRARTVQRLAALIVQAARARNAALLAELDAPRR